MKMKKKIKKHLLLEQLEERVFLDANPIAAAEPVDVAPDHIEPVESIAADPLPARDATGPHIDIPGDQEQITVEHAEQTGVASVSSDTADATDQNTGPEAHTQPSSASDDASTTAVSTTVDPGVTTHTAADSQEQAAPDNDENTGLTTATATTDSTESGHSLETMETNQPSQSTGTENALAEDTPAAHSDDTVTDHTSETVAPDQEAIDPMIGEDFTFTVDFNNTTGSDVYGPYIDLLLDGGQDGNDAATDDGITFVSADYLGTNVTSTVINITQNEVDNGITHPWATDTTGAALIVHDINGQAFHVGDQFVSLRMPFGSFTPAQPAADVTITAHMGTNADVDVDLGVHTTTGAMYGHDALNNPATDNPLRDISTTSTSYKPEVITYHKDIIVPDVAGDCQQQHAGTDDTRYFADDGSQVFEQNHQEIPTGPNYPATYVATIDIADGQTVTGLQLTEQLPDNIYYLGDNTLSVTVGGTLLTQGTDYTVTSPGQGVHGNDTIRIQLTGSVQGGSGNQDVVIRYDFYVPEQDAAGTSIINPATGDDTHITNNGEVGYSWDPATNNQGDPNDTPITNATINAEVNADGHFSSNPNVDDISHAQSLSIQKDHTLIDNATGIAGEYNPGDTLDYSLDFQLSDYFSFGDRDTTDTDYSFRIDDVIADGLTMQNTGGTFTATIDLSANGVLYHQVLSDTGTPGETMWTTLDADNNLLVHYNLQKIFDGWGITNGILQGDIADGNGIQDGATHGSITYQAVIGQAYHSEDNSGTGGSDNDVDQGDVLDGGVTITGDVYANGAFSGSSEADGSCDSIQIVTGSVDKDIFAVNGVTPSQPGNPHISPGDTVTYRLHYEMPLSSTEDFHLTDYLPLPIFDADATGWSFDATEYTAGNGNAPAPGNWAYTNLDSYHDLTGVNNPTVSADGAQNSLIFDWDPYHNQSGGSDNNTVIDIVFTVTASNEPFADGMFLTNQVRATEQGTPLADNSTDAIVQVVLDQPELQLTKGVVETDNDITDATTPTFSANATVDDLFTEPGTGGFRSEGGTVLSSDWLAAHDIDTSLHNVDAGDTVTMAIVVENIGHSGAFDVTITDVLPTGYGTASNIHVTDGAGTVLTYSGDLFGAGLVVDDDADGGLDAYDAASGTNILVITYDLQLQNSVGPDQTLTNTAAVTNFAGAEGATDHTSQDITDEAVTRVTDVGVDKVIATTSQPDTVTSGSNVVIGETVTYRVSITLPEGSATNVDFSDVLDPGDGLEILSLDSLTDSSGGDILSSLDGGGTQIDNSFLANHGTIAADGLSFGIDFGDLENQNRDNTTPETITLTYTALVRNISHNQNTVDLNNTAHWNWTDGNGATQSAGDSETVTIVEPDLQVTKTVPAGLTPDAGDTFTYTLVVEHDGSSTSDAFDAVMSDPVLAGLTYVNGTLASSGAATASLTYNAVTNTIDATWDALALGTSTTITFDVTVADPIQAGTDLTNTADISWTSLPDGTPGTNDANERTGAGGVNDYSDTDTLTLTVAGTIDKENPVPTTYTIGDEVTYDIVVSLPEGTTNNLVVTDALPSGMEYVSFQVLPGSFNGTLTTTPTVDSAAGDGNDITWSFGNVSVTTDNDTTNNSFTLQVTTRVLDIPANHDDPDAGGPAVATSLINAASMTYDNPNGGTITTGDPTDPAVTVTEPWIETTKTVDQTTGVEAGDTLTYTVAMRNGGNATAYEVNFNDILAPGTDFGAVQNAAIDGTAVAAGSTSVVGTTVTFSDDTWDLDPGQMLTLTYTVNVTSAALIDGTHTNTVDADWSSRDGNDPHERIYDESDGIDSPVDDGVNADRDIDTAVFAMDPVTIDKSDGGVTGATIGDTITYTLTITSPQGTIDNFMVQDVLARGMVFNNDAVITTASGSFSTENPQDPTFTVNDGSADVTISWNLGDTVVGTDDPLIITYTATVANVPGNSIGTALGNTASIAYDNAQGGHRTPAPVTDGFTVTEPQITTDKTVVDSVDTGTDASPGEILTYTARFTNTGDAEAYEVNALDTLAPGTHFNVLLSALDNTGVDLSATTTMTDNGDGTVSISGDWDIEVGDWVEVQYTVTVLSAGFTAGTHTNTVDADWSSQNGTSNPNDRLYEDQLDGSGNPLYGVDSTQDENSADFTVLAAGSIGDTVFFDADGDGGPFSATAGDTTPDVGIAGVTVHLYADMNDDGDFTDPGDILLQTDVTDTNGEYIFNALPAFADYIVVVDPAAPAANGFSLSNAGYSQTYDLDEGTAALDHTATSISLTAGQNRTDIDFGYTGQNSVGDTVWFDLNGNGSQDSGEDGIGGLTVTLTADIDNDGTVDYTSTTTTDEHGLYHFDHLPAGDFNIAVTPPAGSTPTYDQDSGTGAPNNATPFNLAADQDRDDIDFGLQGTGSIGDYVWYDTNADTNQINDGPNAGIAGVEVTLSGDIDGDGTVDYTATTTTAADGSYLFNNLLGGNYTISVTPATLPGGAGNWTQTFDEDGTGSADTATHTLAAGSHDTTVDFGYTGIGSLGDTVWYDANANGVQEGGELGLAGVTVTIFADVDGDGLSEYSASTTTDANGNYHFIHLVGADYTISVDSNTLPAGATPTYDLDSATNSPDSTTAYTLTTGENTDRVDFGYTGTGSIGDTVWNDINGDGFQDTGENGFAGVAVTLTGDLDHDGQADDTITTITDGSGHYSFDNLFLGDYTVAVDASTLPPGNSQTHDLDDPQTTTPNTPNSANVTLDTANPVNNDVDFGYNSKGTIGDTIWYDADNNGVQDPGELGLAGVTVTLSGDVDGDGNTDTITTTTNAQGQYLFDQLMAGDYTITVSNLPAGMVQSADPDGTSDNSTTLTLAGGETNLDQDFGYTGTGTIGDTIWNDADGNGTNNGGTEAGLAGVTVTLQADLNNDGVLDTVTTVTDTGGNYHFENLPADTYTITVDSTTLPPGMQQTADPDGTNDNTSTVLLTAGETNNDQDFGYRQTGTIGDTIWYDADGNGIQDPGEPGLNGVTVTLTDSGGNTVDTAITGNDGKYLFDNLTAGDYTVTLTGLPNGMQQTADPDGGNDNTAQITIGGSSSLVNLDQDFGYTGTGSIGDTIWNDANGDGTQDPGETGLAGVTVTLSGDFNGDGTPDTVTVTTDSSGRYHFDRLPEGQYTITVDPTTLPPGMQQTADPDGGNDNSANVTLGGGNPMVNLDQDFGYRQSGTIGDTIWFDADGDGIQDPGELGLAGVQVTLVGDLDGDGLADDTLTTITDANGNYLFDTLPAGTYAITVDPTTLPAGMAETFDLDGTGSANTAQVTIGEHEVNLDVDFGYKGTGSIGDTIWFDADNDGTQNPDEIGIPGVTVTITGDFDNDGRTDNTMTVTTGPDGTYLFPNLPAGEYDITVDPSSLPGGMNQTFDPDNTRDNTTHLILNASENNLNQDFGYTGTGTIGDQLWIDQNGNGMLDPGEAPLPGVEVCIGVDLDGDGLPDYRATTITGSNGTYIFDNLPAGAHTLCVNPATLPPGIRPGFDADGTLDNSTIIDLGPGERNTTADFGYIYPPKPVPPVSPVVPPVPLIPPVVIEPDFANDPLLPYQQFSDRAIEDIFLYPFDEIPWQMPIVPVSPMYTGLAEPGTTLQFTLYDCMGNQIGQQSIMADTAGNWLVDFPGTIMFDLPHHMEIQQTLSTYNASSAGFFNMRTYFNPNFNSMVYSTAQLDVATIFAYLPSTIMESIHASTLSTLNIQWNNFNGYEFFAPSTHPAEDGH